MNFTSLIRKLAVAVALAAAPVASYAGIFISVGFAPPALPVYVQPVCPGDGYLWNPGYWAYGDNGYYWVPGVWVQPPTVGLLWTPGYWGWGGGAYIFHAGYWGPHVGFYGGINYGFGYGGSGFYGGRWDGGHFAYNTAVVNVNRTVIHNTYVQNVTVNNTAYNHTSFNGGSGGVPARPTATEAQYEHENHVPPTAAQQSHVQAARAIPTNYAKANGGRPAMAAIERPGAMNTAVAARGATPAPRTATQQNGFGRTAAQPNARPNAEAQRPAGSSFSQPNRAAAQTSVQPSARPAPQSQPRPQAQPREQARPQAAPRPQARPAEHAEAKPQAQHSHR
jgi:hypothetical protein